MSVCFAAKGPLLMAKLADDIEVRTLASLFGVLADPTRLRLLAAMTLECKSVSQLARETNLDQPRVSHHLRILRDAGVARHERRGAFVYY